MFYIYSFQEFNDLFDEVNTKVLLCVACLSPDNGIPNFDKKILVFLAQFFLREFSPTDLMALGNQLKTYIVDIHINDEFVTIKGIDIPAKILFETKKKRHEIYSIVYLLVKVTLVVTATVERAVSAMKIGKSNGRLLDE